MRLACLKTSALALMLALAVAGCGRKGPLEAPSTAVPVSEAVKPEDKVAITPLPKRSVPAAPQQEVPKKPFFLDFLL